MDKIQSYRYTAEEPGPRVLFFGTIHGDEVCGYKALSKLQQQLASGEIKLLCGEVTLVPLCNPRAYGEGKRFCEENLNRIFKHHHQPKSYEARLANQLCALMPGQDYFVDLHAAPDTNEPFAIVDHVTPQTLALFQMTGLGLCMTGWPELFANSDSPSTTDEAERLGIPSLTIECGQYLDPNAPQVAYDTAVRIMAGLGLLEAEVSEPAEQKRLHLIQLGKKTDEGNFTKSWRQGDVVRQGTCIVIQRDGTKVCAAADGVLVMPDPNVPMGEAWFYLAEER